MNKDEFGGACWTTLHALAGNALELDKRLAFCDMVRSLQKCFPCEHCAEHLAMTLDKHPIKNYTSSAEELLRWTWIAHNAANEHYNQLNPNRSRNINIPFSIVRDRYRAIPDPEEEVQNLKSTNKPIKLVLEDKSSAFSRFKTDINTTNFRRSKK